MEYLNKDTTFMPFSHSVLQCDDLDYRGTDLSLVVQTSHRGEFSGVDQDVPLSQTFYYKYIIILMAFPHYVFSCEYVDFLYV